MLTTLVLDALYGNVCVIPVQERKLREIAKKHGVVVEVVKSRNGAVSVEGDADGIASVVDELMQLVLQLKDKSATQREAELLTKQVARIRHITAVVY